MKLFPISLYILLVSLLPSQVTQDEINSSIEGRQFINSFEEDITGDGLREYLRLEGVLLSNQSSYFRQVWLDITGPFSKQWKISLANGYAPELHIIDLTNDDRNDLFFKIAQTEALSHYSYQLFTMNKDTIQQIQLPKPEHVRFSFLDNFMYKVETELLDKSETFSISPEGLKTMNESIYRKDGTLLKQTQLTIEPHFILEPIYIDKSKGYGLKSTQHIPSFERTDILYTIETIWSYDTNKWIKLQTTVQ